MSNTAASIIRIASVVVHERPLPVVAVVGDDHDQLEQEEERRQRHDARYREVHGEQSVARVHPEYPVEVPEVEDVQHPEDLEDDERDP